MGDDQTRMRYFRLVAIVGSVVAVLLVLAIWGDRCALPEVNGDGARCGSRASNWLYDFQTLIAGLFAVGAAGITIYLTKEIADRQIKSQNYLTIAEINTVATTLSIFGRETTGFCRIFLEATENQSSEKQQRIYLRMVVKNLRRFLSEYRNLRERSQDRLFNEAMLRSMDNVLNFERAWAVDPLDERGKAYDIESDEWIEHIEPGYEASVPILKTYVDFFLLKLEEWKTEKHRDLG
ncbi:hypothetical protein CQ054_05970 [Ochrobactrum sp. MYb29]|nr:hypothetical protein CQ054_05970 [Ochrobactrum sp. MYb29]